MLDITCRSHGMRDAEAQFNLGGPLMGALKVTVSYQGDRYRRVGAVWVPSLGEPVTLLKGFDNYLDVRTRAVVDAQQVATDSSNWSRAHSLHGRDYRRLMDEGLIK